VISLSPEPTVVPSRSYYSSTTLEDEHVFLKVFIVRHFGSVGATSIIWELGSRQLPKGQYLAFGCLSSREKLGGDLKRVAKQDLELVRRRSYLLFFLRIILEGVIHTLLGSS
jgi:hypothetical protein